MSNVAAFVAAAEKAEPSLVGQNDKDKAAIAKLVGETEAMAKDLTALNDKLSPLTYLHANAASSADVSLYAHLHPSMATAPASQHSTHPAVLRYFLQVQSLPPVQSAQSSMPNDFQPIEVDVASLPTPERKAVAAPVKVKKDKKAGAAAAPASAPAAAEGSGVLASVASAVSNAAAAASATVVAAAENVKAAVVGGAGESAPAESSTDAAAAAPKGNKQKKEKKEKPAKGPAPVKEEPTGPMPSMIDMRVGKVLDVRKHPEADSLYIEMIDVGEPEPRQVCSGLVKYMTEDEIRGQTIVVICNLKPATMRGVKSFAMLLCATAKEGKEAGGVQFVLPPAGSQPGERIYFEGEKYENAKPEAQLNPKKKVFETIQPGFLTLDNLEAAWIDPETKSVHRIRTKDGVCKAQSFVGASLS